MPYMLTISRKQGFSPAIVSATGTDGHIFRNSAAFYPASQLRKALVQLGIPKEEITRAITNLDVGDTIIHITQQQAETFARNNSETV